MNVRSEFRQAFRQYRKRLGLPLACPNSEIRAGELCFFNVDGTVVSLGNVLDDLEEDKCATTTTVQADIDPIISNGIRCRSLSASERETCDFPDNKVDEACVLSREKFNVPDYALLCPSLIKTEINYTTAMHWINSNAKAISILLNDYNVDPDYGLVLVLTQWSAPGYTRIVIPSNLAEEGIIMGQTNDKTWVEGTPPEDNLPTLTMIDDFTKEMESTLFVNGLSINKATVVRRLRDMVGLSCYSGDREWKKYLSVKKIA